MAPLSINCLKAAPSRRTPKNFMHIAISPCPNDTFLFFPWIMGFVGKNVPITPHFFDIQHLNMSALNHTFPLTKLSFPAFAKIKDHYDLLPVGSALGFGNGPKVISKTPYKLEELQNLRVAIPGKETTAHLLCSLFLPPIEKHFCLYHEVLDLVQNGTVDCGVLIHESRFLFEKKGLYQIADLGEIFTKKTGAPLPLGGLALKKEYQSQKEEIISILLDSMAFARSHPEKGIDFIIEKSQEKERSIIEQHINLYVNQETATVSKTGEDAIALLLSLSS